MSIRDVSGLPDDMVPAWVRRAREDSRAIVKRRREFLAEEKAKLAEEKAT